MILEFTLSGTRSSESLFKVLNFLLKFNDLVLLFVEEAGVIKGSFSFFSGVVDFTFQQSIDFMFKKEEPAIEDLSLVSSNDDAGARAEELFLEFEDGSSESSEGGEV